MSHPTPTGRRLQKEHYYPDPSATGDPPDVEAVPGIKTEPDTESADSTTDASQPVSAGRYSF